ncbi:MAG TPA: carboxypeptidase-like regulatory domain-containing protein [Terriglobales bacterium]|nr:carboxypeptidase-like regulatory domain-containing protein [Terriglobales bacterium]
MRRWAAVLVVAVLAVCAGAQQQKTSDLKFQVLKERNGKPIRNASVILHTVDKEGKQGKGGLQTKTDAEGRATIPGIPYGKMRVQVIAHGFQTFGADYDIAQPEQEFVIKLKLPQEQYTIYK